MFIIANLLFIMNCIFYDNQNLHLNLCPLSNKSLLRIIHDLNWDHYYACWILFVSHFQRKYWHWPLSESDWKCKFEWTQESTKMKDRCYSHFWQIAIIMLDLNAFPTSLLSNIKCIPKYTDTNTFRHSQTNSHTHLKS